MFNLYRTNSPPPPETVKKVPFNQSHPVGYKIGKWVVGAIAIVGAVWFAFPGAYMLGHMVNALTFKNMFSKPDDDIVCNWVLGVGSLILPVGFFFLARHIGNEIAEKIESR